MSAAPPGWYRDPGGSTSWRWWDGSRWTEHLMAYAFSGPAPGQGGERAFSVRSALESEARLNTWATAAASLYVVVQVVSTIAVVATFPAFVKYLRQIFNRVGTATPPPQPTAFHLTSTFELPLVVVSGAVFLVWQHRAAITARALGYPARRSPALGAWSWIIPVVNLWFPYQALRDILPPGHRLRALVVRTWLCYVLTLLAVALSYVAAFSSTGFGQAVGCLAIAGWIFVGAGAYRFTRAVAADHAAAAARY